MSPNNVQRLSPYQMHTSPNEYVTYNQIKSYLITGSFKRRKTAMVASTFTAEQDLRDYYKNRHV